MGATQIREPQPQGRRERKKAATRKAIADAALRLFLERGYDDVGIREIADAADVSTATLFKHFPSKEALVFDMDTDREASLRDAVQKRPEKQSILAALRDYVLARADISQDAEMARFLELIRSTPALSEYAHRMWMRHEGALTEAITEASGAPPEDPVCGALAHFVLETTALARTSGDPRTAVESAFDLLEHGWNATGSGV
ncbi:TetR/AcrR family transcriptional regulator [Actinoallomurus bryophytorum]|uniref:TetR family transcriptional regulator n=1 Tax=Actinoallomurus bryophytorum TaxID=1490222 RepID=A0A543CS94_9ACTN|nr:TetR/AcrR family transcriptional regulator [Actinoallomurus bryophytorum]TQL99787.1 TetR family transcriptional regulator [Actinoallomurus bryophytorum]